MRDVNSDWEPLPGKQKQPPPSNPANPGAPTPLRVDVHTGTFADNEWVYFKVESEICLGQWDSATTKFDTVYRGLFNTDVVTHDAGAEWTEVVPVVPYESDGPLESRYSKFTAGCTPEDVILTLLVSGATQTGTSLEGYRTLLPDGWGLGFDPTRIDLLSFQIALQAHHSNTVLGGVVAESVVFADWVKENILKPFGLYLASHADDQLYCGLNQIGNYDKYFPQAGPQAGGIRTIDSTEAIGVPKWRGAIDKVVGALEMEGDSGVGTEAKTVKVEVFTDAVRNYGGSWRTLQYRSCFLFSRNDVPGAMPSPDGGTAGMHAPFGRLRDYLQARWTKVPGIATVKTRLSALDVELGATVMVNLPTLPNMLTPTLGGTQWAQVIGKKVDDAAGTIEFELAVYGHQMVKNCNWGACAYIASAVGSVGTCSGRFYNVGPAYEAALFTVGDVVDIYSAYTLTRIGANVYVTAINLTNGTITATGMAANSIVVPATFQQCTAGQRAAGPYAASATGLLYGNTPPFRWSSR